ncbi:hypothetical protein T261_2602 [Streptomyces lydicus]|nr:hypothetical protein T261_2602 [Streptomyces lydicus]
MVDGGAVGGGGGGGAQPAAGTFLHRLSSVTRTAVRGAAQEASGGRRHGQRRVAVVTSAGRFGRWRRSGGTAAPARRPDGRPEADGPGHGKAAAGMRSVRGGGGE